MNKYEMALGLVLAACEAELRNLPNVSDNMLKAFEDRSSKDLKSGIEKLTPEELGDVHLFILQTTEKILERLLEELGKVEIVETPTGTEGQVNSKNRRQSARREKRAALDSGS